MGQAAADLGGDAARAAGDVPLECRAWAKLNLYLRVTGRRADGYHSLDSLIVFAGVGDRLTFAPSERLTLEVAGRFAAAVPQGAGAGPDNLVIRAAEALRAAVGGGAGARICLDKQLPAAAGLGGGSADAAAALAGLVRLWSLDPRRLPLAAIAAGLGADVPVCCYGRPAFVGGIGTELERAPPLPPAWLVLANPGVDLPTPAVFRARRGGFSAPGRWSEVDGSAEALAARLATLDNDLEAPALALAPEIGPLLAALRAAPGALLARMSGSGASCFALFAGRAAAKAAGEALQAAHPGWWVAVAPLLHGPLRPPPAP